MNERLLSMRNKVRRGEQRLLRQSVSIDVLGECDRENLSWPKRVTRLIQRQCQAEQPVIGSQERIVFTRTLPGVPPVYSSEDWSGLIEGHTLHELGPVSNICADWSLLLKQGLLGRRLVAVDSRARLQADPQAVEFLDCAVETIDAVLELVGRYTDEARRSGRDDLVSVLEQVPAYPARTFYEALQSLRFGHSIVWLGGNYHVGLGRFDQYMYPYVQADLDAGRLTIPEAEQLVAEFFISLNRDSDLYPGVQQGDNGQSLTLGGVKPDGLSAVNELTRIVLRVSRDLELIDPKINLRISPDTDLDLLSLATELTCKGLGFPQYSNDAVVIPALLAHGYDMEDARDYCVAACWEFIIPGRGMEVVNIGAVSFPAAVDRAIRTGLVNHSDFSQILSMATDDIRVQVNSLADAYSHLLLPPAPYYSIFMHGCLERGRDVSEGLKYNNFGIHGAGSANAADALSAVKHLVFDARSLSGDDLLAALESDFAGFETIRRRLVDEGPKVGRNDDRADAQLSYLFKEFSMACAQYGKNPRGGILRPGSGSAMYYMWLAGGHAGMREPVVGSTADGRLRGEPFSANLAPSPGIPVRGPISTLQSFSRIDYTSIFNGGPITMELSDSVFRDPESIRKVAMLVRIFAQLGCQQLQLNSLNADILLDARAHPEKHRDLIVRVWGWSGYFCELAPEYQDHIIARTLYTAG